MNVSFNGKEYSMAAELIRPGEALPDLSLTTRELADFTRENVSFPVLFLTSPSVDNGPCSHDLLAFSQRLEDGPFNTFVVTVDLPFALDRWVTANGVSTVTLLSDHRERSFGRSTGTLVEGLMFLARTALLFDRDGKCVYAKIGPDYDEVMTAVRGLT